MIQAKDNDRWSAELKGNGKESIWDEAERVKERVKQSQITQGFINHSKDFGFYFKDKWKSLRCGFKNEKNMISSVCVEASFLLQGWKSNTGIVSSGRGNVDP